MKPIVILTFLFFALNGIAQAQDAAFNGKAVASLDTNIIAIGAQTELTLELFATTFPMLDQWPVEGDTLNGGLEIIERSGIDTLAREGQVILRERYLVTSFDTGFVVIAPHVFFVNGKPVDSNPLLLQVTYPIIQGEGELKDIYDIADVDYSWIDLLKEKWWLAALVAAFVAAITFLVKRIKQTAASASTISPQIPRLDPDKEALAALAILEEEALWQRGKFKEYHSRLADVLRNYLERTYMIRVHERTTFQILSDLKSKGIDPNLLGQLRVLLELADLAKFAKYRPIAEENEASMSNAIEFIHHTRKVSVNG